MPRQANHDPSVGDAILAARRADPPVPWKVLMREHGYGRTRLWMLFKEAEAREAENGEKTTHAAGGVGECVHEHLGVGHGNSA